MILFSVRVGAGLGEIQLTALALTSKLVPSIVVLLPAQTASCIQQNCDLT
jgi:hypothetical protein